jgi:dienelactone hydrolase
VRVPADGTELAGELRVPAGAVGVVAFAHGSGSSRHSPRNGWVAEQLHRGGLATLLLDLLTAAEEERDRRTGELRFDVENLGRRLTAAIDWLGEQTATSALPVGCFGASTGAAAALLAAAARPARVGAVVSRGGRPDLAGETLVRVIAPTLLIVGAADPVVLELNEAAFEHIAAVTRRIEVLDGASHLFQEPGALDRVAELARGWFLAHLRSG